MSALRVLTRPGNIRRRTWSRPQPIARCEMKKIVEVRGATNADVLLRQEKEHSISGLAVIVAEATELTVGLYRRPY